MLFAAAAVLAASGAVKAKKKAPAKKPVPALTAKKPAAGPQDTRYRKTPYVGAIAVDAATSNVLFEANAEVTAYPASVTKLMTALLVLEDVATNAYAFADYVTATPDVYKSEASWVGLKAGEKMSVKDLLAALMVESANDAAIALGVHSAGSLEAFTARMNERAKELGMVHTCYYNPNGLPPKGRRYPWKNFNVTTARDQSRLALALVNNNPRILEFTSIKTCDLVKTPFGYRVSVTRRANDPKVYETPLASGEQLVKAMRNHNNVMVKDKFKLINPDGKEAVDGLKTGYIEAGGSSVVLTGSRNARRAVVVVLGSSSSEVRDTEARQLLLDALGAISW